MEAADVSAVERLAHCCLAEAWTAEGFLADVENPKAIPLTARRNGEVVGFLCATVICGEGSIALIATREDLRGQGIASALLEKLFLLGREQGADWFTLEVRASNRAAIGFYRKHGFQPVGRRRDFYTAPREDALLYTFYFSDKQAN